MILKRVGGKAKLARWIVNHIPVASNFVDVFGGSGAVLDEMARRRPKLRYVYNDIDSKLYIFFRVLRDAPDFLAELVNLTPYSRRFYDEAFDIFESKAALSELSELDQALVFVIVNRQSFGSKMDGTWSIARDGEINYETWNRLPKSILKVAQRWKNVYLENLDYCDLIPKWDHKDTVFYVDPPYEGVEDFYYEANRDDGFDHEKLLSVLRSIQGSFCLSYYGGKSKAEDSDLIKSYESLGCRIYRKSVFKHLQTREEKDEATEVLIVKGRRPSQIRKQLIEDFG
jgi:DNA adenine methylase